MALAWNTTSEVHQNFSSIANKTKKENSITVITKRGKPCLVLLPVEEVNPETKNLIVNTRDINNQWGNYVKKAFKGYTIYIKYNNTIRLQLIHITPEELQDIIVNYSQGLQEKHNTLLSSTENIKKLKSARELLHERKQLRTKNNG